jgi:hypothetical protein
LDTINMSIYWGVFGICEIAIVQLAVGIVRMVLDVYRKRAAALR